MMGTTRIKTNTILLAVLFLAGMFAIFIPVSADGAEFTQYIAGTWSTKVIDVFAVAIGPPWVEGYVTKVNIALEKWNLVIPDDFEVRFNPVQSREDADVIVIFQAGGPVGVMGITLRRFFPRTEVIRSTTVRIHVARGADHLIVEKVVLHEMGHALGLGHSDAIDPSTPEEWRDIMYPELNPGTTHDWPSNLNLKGIFAAFGWVEEPDEDAFAYDVPEYVTILAAEYLELDPSP